MNEFSPESQQKGRGDRMQDNEYRYKDRRTTTKMMNEPVMIRQRCASHAHVVTSQEVEASVQTHAYQVEEQNKLNRSCCCLRRWEAHTWMSMKEDKENSGGGKRKEQ
jgi:hypothetical protein